MNRDDRERPATMRAGQRLEEKPGSETGRTVCE
jgi:hypothetical protein